jgi:TctA family transporter
LIGKGRTALIQVEFGAAEFFEVFLFGAAQGDFMSAEKPLRGREFAVLQCGTEATETATT